MGVLRKSFQEAGTKRAGYPDFGLGWPVFWEYAETVDGDDIFLDAVVKPLRGRRPPGTPAGIEIGGLPSVQDQQERSVKQHIAPLTQHKDLFFEFARHLPRGHVTTEERLKTVRAWVSEYGVLGLFGVDDPRHPGQRESVRGFWRAALDAAMILELYEAAIPKKPDRRLGEVWERWEPGLNWGRIPASEQREHALKRAADKVGQIVKDECYPQVYRVENKARQETQGFVYDFGFYSLLGAMYLQMMLLLTDENNIRQCRRPGCQGIILPHESKKKVHCSTRCRVWMHANKDS